MFAFAAALLLVCGSGASCASRLTLPFYSQAPSAPYILPPGASLSQVIDAVNANSARIATLSTNNASIRAAGLPVLTGNIEIERPRKFRLIAGGALMGNMIDLGSNDEVFWVWLKHSQPPALYYCRHDQYESSVARRLAPIEPQWLIEAMGMGTFPTDAVHEGPILLRDGNLEIRSTRQTPGGSIAKSTIVDANRAWILKQSVYFDGVHVATATASEHFYDPVYGVSLPRIIKIELPTSQLVSGFTIDMGNVAINQLGGDSNLRWAMPEFEGYPLVNLGDPASTLPVSAIPQATSPLTNLPNFMTPGAAGFPPPNFTPLPPPVVSGSVYSR